MLLARHEPQYTGPNWNVVVHPYFVIIPSDSATLLVKAVASRELLLPSAFPALLAEHPERVRGPIEVSHSLSARYHISRQREKEMAVTMSSDSRSVMIEHSKTSQQTAFSTDSCPLEQCCVSAGGKRPCEAELRVTVPRKGAPACWLILARERVELHHAGGC